MKMNDIDIEIEEVENFEQDGPVINISNIWK